VICEDPFQLKTVPLLFEIFKHADRIALNQLKKVVSQNDRNEPFKRLLAHATTEFAPERIERIHGCGRALYEYELGAGRFYDLGQMTKFLDGDPKEHLIVIGELLNEATPLIRPYRLLRRWFDEISNAAKTAVSDLILVHDSLPVTDWSGLGTSTLADRM